MKTRIFKTADLTPQQITALSREIEQGAVAVLPTDTVYGIATGAFAEASIQQIYRIKNRPATSPLQLLAPNVEVVRTCAEVSPEAEKIAAAFWPGGLTLILPPKPHARNLTRGFAGLGFRVPDYTFLTVLLEQMQTPMACTSANLHDQPVITEEQTLVETFDGKVDFIFRAGTLSPTASSVVDMTVRPRLLREGSISRNKLERVLGVPLG